MGSMFRRFLAVAAVVFYAWGVCWDASAQQQGCPAEAKVSKVVLDPGHGGKDPGCVFNKYYEKDITLSIAQKLGALIEKNCPDVEVVYTRTTDKYVYLVDRGKIANRENADLFISIHINSATNSSARGTSTHVMGMSKSSQNLEVAMKENDVIIYEDDYTTKYEGYNPGDPASYIMFSLMQYAYSDQSMMFAGLVQKHFKRDLPMPDRGTSQEPFLVLWRTSMPSVLVEVGFLSNQTDRTYITSNKGQNEAARSLFNAFSEYKSTVEGRTSVVMLKENAGVDKNAKDRQPETRLVGQEAYDGVLYYVQLCFVADRHKPGDRIFKSYRNRVIEKVVKGRGYRYLVGGLRDYDDIVELQSQVRREFPDAFVVAYEGDNQIDIKTARRKTGQ